MLQDVSQCFGLILGVSAVSGCFRLFWMFVLFPAASGQAQLFQVFLGVSGCFEMFPAVSGYFRLFRGVSGCFRLFRDVSGCFGLLFPGLFQVARRPGSSLESGPAARHLYGGSPHPACLPL